MIKASGLSLQNLFLKTVNPKDADDDKNEDVPATTKTWRNLKRENNLLQEFKKHMLCKMELMRQVRKNQLDCIVEQYDKRRDAVVQRLNRKRDLDLLAKELELKDLKAELSNFQSRYQTELIKLQNKIDELKSIQAQSQIELAKFETDLAKAYTEMSQMRSRHELELSQLGAENEQLKSRCCHHQTGLGEMRDEIIETRGSSGHQDELMKQLKARQEDGLKRNMLAPNKRDIPALLPMTMLVWPPKAKAIIQHTNNTQKGTESIQTTRNQNHKKNNQRGKSSKRQTTEKETLGVPTKKKSKNV